MKITFHGAAQTVTGSQHLLEVNGYTILLDCGLFQGKRSESFTRTRNFQFDVRKLDAVILSHAHIDHSGNLPNLLKNGFRGPIFTTPATAHLGNIMLLDSAHIQEIDAENISYKNSLKKLPPVEPLYTISDAAQVAQHFDPVGYEKPFEVVPGVMGKLVDAGHILGSAAVMLDIEEKTNGSLRKLRLWFSGDIGRRGLPLLRDPELPRQADYLVMECTYGDKSHSDPHLAYDELREVISRTVKRGGKVIIPSFAVGRTQDLVYDLQIMMSKGEVPRVPVIVDSPLAVSASDIYRNHLECFDAETQKMIQEDRHHSVLGFDLLTYTRSVDESKALNLRKDPMIIISAAGMAENGRIRHHLKYNVENPLNTILIVSWQAPDTLGRRIAEREPRLHILGDVYSLKAEVATIGGLSAHAGQDFLSEYAGATKESLKYLFLVHSETKAADPFRARLAGEGFDAIHYPEMHETVEI
jgi:metallo-beta-lactamase family protein